MDKNRKMYKNLDAIKKAWSSRYDFTKIPPVAKKQIAKIVNNINLLSKVTLEVLLIEAPLII